MVRLDIQSEKELKARKAKRNRSRPKTEYEKGYDAKKKLAAQDAADRLKKAAEAQSIKTEDTVQGDLFGNFKKDIDPKAIIMEVPKDVWGGFEAYAEAENKKRHHKHGSESLTPEDSAEQILIHSAANWAVGEYFKIPWAAGAKTKVGGAFVQGTLKRNNRLLAHKDDPLGCVYVLVYVDCFRHSCEMKGWAFGSEIKREENWGDPCQTGRKCFALPRADIRAMRTLECTNGRLWEVSKK